MEKSNVNTPSTDYETYSLREQIKALEKRCRALEVENARLVRDVDFMSNLPIPVAGKEFAKSIERSVKFRVTRAIWGKESFYQSNDELVEYVPAIMNETEAHTALRIIQENDMLNLFHLSSEPSYRRVAVYETVRKISHAPRRFGKLIKRKAV